MLNNKEPLFGCEDCYDEYSWRVDDLGVYQDMLFCEDCWSERQYNAEEDSDIKGIDFCDLEPFIPWYETRIKELEELVTELYDQLEWSL